MVNDEYALAIIGTYIFTSGSEDISELDKLEQNEYIDKIKKYIQTR